MKSVSAKIEALTPVEIRALLDGATLSVEAEGKTWNITQESILVNRKEKAQLKVINEGSLTLALDAEVTRELKWEGHVRDAIRAIQNARKEAGLEVSDRIALTLGGSSLFHEAITAFADYLTQETLAKSWVWAENVPEGAIEMSSDEEKLWFVLQKA